MRDLVNTNSEIRASGGFARSESWLQMTADLFGYEVLVPEVFEGSGFGAAVLAMVAVGQLARLEDVEQLIRVNNRYCPNPEVSHRYHQLFELYDRIYKNTMDEASALGSFT